MIRKNRTSLKLRLSLASVTRLVMLTEDWPWQNVYPPHTECTPQDDQDLLIALLEEARDVWKPISDAALMATDEEDTLPGEPLER